MKIFIYILLFLYTSISMIPFLDSSDKAGNQWLFLSVLNFFSFIIFFFDNKPVVSFKSPLFKSITFFFVLVSLSLLYSNNITLSLQDLARQATVYCSVFFLSHFFFHYKLNLKIIFSFFIFSLFIESFYSLLPIFTDYFLKGINIFEYSSINIDALMGLSGNRNITTAALVIKLPFLFYFIFNTNSFLKSILLSTLLFLASLVVFLISSRAALLSFSISIFIFILFSIYQSRSLLSFYKAFLVLLFTGLSFALSNIILPSSNPDGIDRIQSIALTNEASSNRFVLWSNAIDYISSNPFIGAGIGNWKIESSAYWGSLGENYLVPYHAHNDFLEYSTELGILGGLVYLSFFFFAILYLFKLFSINSQFSIVLFMVLGVYFVDSSLNFPFERPIMQVPFVFLLSLITSQNSFKDE